VNDYLDIQRGRFGDRLSVELAIDPAVMNARALAVAEGDYLMVHGRFSRGGRPTRIVVDILRVEGGRLAEHWDVVQDEATKAQSKSGLPMFGVTFPQ
jgi:predicted SnoaL-like aldol condensation-catalyzing enzyme